jgi:hypothetical protein
MGWNGYQKPEKSQAELDVIRRHELGMKFYSDIDELVQLAAKSKKKIKLIPPAPHRDEDIAESREPAVMGPCQVHVAHMKAWRAAKAAGAVIARDDGPYVSEREKKLAAARAYNKARYKPSPRKKAKGAKEC